MRYTYKNHTCFALFTLCVYLVSNDGFFTNCRCTQLRQSLTFIAKMGYDLHITRREDWADRRTPDILLDEWLSYIEHDKELELTNGNNITIGSETQFQNRPGFCEWNSHPTEKSPNTRPWFAFWEGSIDTKNADESHSY